VRYSLDRARSDAPLNAFIDSYEFLWIDSLAVLRQKPSILIAESRDGFAAVLDPVWKGFSP